MILGELLLILAVVFTVGHAVSDTYIATKRILHPRDTVLTFVSLAFLLGHVIFTGELTEWLALVVGK